MPPQSAEPDCSYAVFPAPSMSRAIPLDHHPKFPQSAQSPPASRLEELLAKIKQQYDLLADTNAHLRSSLHQLNEERKKALQMSHLKDQYIQAAQQHIQELQQKVNKLKDIAVQMQKRESRLEACEQHISRLEQSFEKLTKLKRDRNGPLLAEEQNGIHELAQSVNELEVGTALKSEKY